MTRGHHGAVIRGPPAAVIKRAFKEISKRYQKTVKDYAMGQGLFRGHHARHSQIVAKPLYNEKIQNENSCAASVESRPLRASEALRGLEKPFENS